MIISKQSHFEQCLRQYHDDQGEPFSEKQVESFVGYYDLVLKWNSRLHLTTLIEPQPFFQRHIFESVFATRLLLNEVGSVWDLGSGLGVPGLPIAIVRPELIVNLVESKRSKAVFLEETISALNLLNVKVRHDRIEAIESYPDDSCLAARAVEHMEEIVSRIIGNGNSCLQLIFWGSDKLVESISKHAGKTRKVEVVPLPDADRRVIYNLTSST